MMYIKVKWVNNFPGEPGVIYSEMNDERWERRKIEVFPDGSVIRADPLHSVGATRLAEEPLPSNDEIVKDPQFILEEISRREFEELWCRAISDPNMLGR